MLTFKVQKEERAFSLLEVSKLKSPKKKKKSEKYKLQRNSGKKKNHKMKEMLNLSWMTRKIEEEVHFK